MERDVQYEMDVLEQMFIDGKIDDKEYDERMEELMKLANEVED